mgnify:CR=1 FL=1
MESKGLNQISINIHNYSGPLEVLLDLAKTQKVDLAEISITKLADQFLDFIKNNENLNLESASEHLLMATWLAYLKSKLLLPEDEDDDFKALEVAEKLKLQLKKLELIRLLSEQMLKRKRLGREIRTRGMRAGIKSIYNSEYKLNLFDLLKTYSSIIMTKDFQRINIPKLPVFTAEEGIKTIRDFFGNLRTVALDTKRLLKKVGAWTEFGASGWYNMNKKLGWKKFEKQSLDEFKRKEMTFMLGG